MIEDRLYRRLLVKIASPKRTIKKGDPEFDPPEYVGDSDEYCVTCADQGFCQGSLDYDIEEILDGIHTDKPTKYAVLLWLYEHGNFEPCVSDESERIAAAIEIDVFDRLIQYAENRALSEFGDF